MDYDHSFLFPRVSFILNFFNNLSVLIIFGVIIFTLLTQHYLRCRQGRSKWAARFASVRLNSRAPWEQKRQIVGMVKSPVEGNSIVILKMDKPVIFSGKYILVLLE